MTEAEFLKQVLQFARLHRWRAAHFRPAMTRSGRWVTACQADAAGFPDLLLLRGLEAIVTELKVGTRKTTHEQDLWLASFGAAGIPAFIWTPKDWPLIERTLGSGS